MCLALLVCAVVTSGCAPWRLPRIDPSGRRVFVPGESYRPLAGLRSPTPPPWAGPPIASAPVSGFPTQSTTVARQQVSISPGVVVSPIGSQVIVVADVPGRGSFFSGSQRVEWTLEPGGVGQLADVGRGSWLDSWRSPGNQPGMVPGGDIPGSVPGSDVPGGNVFGSRAIGSTSVNRMRLDRGTALTTDDVVVESGQAWAAVTSQVEGTSHVTAFAPSVSAQNGPRASATIHWIDAQWVFPPPAVGPVGRQHTFTTTVTRQSNGSPIAGWLVRYEIMSGPPAGFGADGAQVVEVTTDE